MPAEIATYERAKDLAQDPDPAVRRGVAARPDTPGEILYFLAGDTDPSVRMSVAENPSTPRQADAILAKDDSYAVRCVLARKIVGAGLDTDTRSQLWRLGFTILEALARDSVVKVREALANGLKSEPRAPHGIVLGLARDNERVVAEPVVRHSPVLNDEDVAGLVDRNAPEWMKSAAACRGKIGPKLADAIVATGSVQAITHLLKNNNARIHDRTMERLVDQAPTVEDWHEPLVNRVSLPRNAFSKLARFVSVPLMSVLRARPDMDEDTAAKIDRIAEGRGEIFAAAAREGALKQGAGKPRRQPVPWKDRPSAKPKPANVNRISAKAIGWNTSQEQVKRLASTGKLTNDLIHQSLVAGDNEFVLAGLSEKAGIPLQTVQRILEAKSGRAITALCWKAGFSMRFAVEVQQHVAHVPPKRMIYARDGHEFPMTDDELDYQIGLFAA